MGFQESDKWEGEPFDPTETLVIGREEKEEWLKTGDMGPLSVEEYR